MKEDPLFRSAVWIECGAAYGSGAIIHSSKDRGTYVLTAGHMVMDDQGFISTRPVEVGVFAPSHAKAPADDYVLYPAEVVATTLEPRPEKSDSLERTLALMRANVHLLCADDFALLRLQTDRLFQAAPIFTSVPAAATSNAAVLVAVAPEMYPHRQEASCDAGSIHCPTMTHGNSGGPVFLNGEIVGIATISMYGPGPEKLQAFLRSRDSTNWLLAPTTTATPTTPRRP